MICKLCAKNCGAKREEVGHGFCGMPNDIVIAHYELFLYEEPCISLNKGSGAVFFSGCSLGCVFCQNYEISSLKKGIKISAQRLAEIFKELEDSGAENINLVNPTHYVLGIIEALKIYRPQIPIIYNTHAYENPQTIKLISNYVDVFLPDLKYKSSFLSERYSGVKNYFQVATKAIKLMRELKKDVFDGEKILQGVIIRHMVLPLCTQDSIDVLNHIKQNYINTKVSLMSQYTPYGRACEYPEINRRLTKHEYQKVLNHFLMLNLQGYNQELSSAKEEYIPKFRYV